MKKVFTLAETLIVIVIIAILAGVAIPNIRRIRAQGEVAKAKADLRALQAGVESYYIHNNLSYPSSLTNLTLATPRIINAIPTDPFKVYAFEYIYTYEPSASSLYYGYDASDSRDYYVIFSVGPTYNGYATIVDNGTIYEANGASCIYVSNAQEDTTP